MIKVFRIFFGAEGTKPLLVLFCLLLAGASEAVSLTSLLPVAAQIGEGHGHMTESPAGQVIATIFSIIGLQPSLGTLILFATITMVLKSVLTFVAISYAGYSVAIVSTALRSKLLDALFKARWRYFTSHRPGKIANAISNDTTRAGDAYFISARFVAYAAQALVYVLVSFIISPTLAGAGLVVGLGLYFILLKLVKTGQKAGDKQTDQTSELVTYVSDALNNIKPIKAMNRSEYFENFFLKKINRLRKALFRKVLASVGLLYGQEALKVIAVGIGVYVAGVYLNTPLSEMVVFGVIFMQVISIISKVQKFQQQAVILESAYWCTVELIQELLANEEPRPGRLTPKLEKSCCFDRVDFSYDDTPVLQQVSFEIPYGSITVLQGSSGSGKTTIIDLLLGLHRPDKGAVLVDGVDLRDIDIAQWRAMTGYVPQELSLLHGTVLENISLGDEAISAEDAYAALEQAGGGGFVKRLPQGLDTIVGEMGARLSGGQRQRIALARALVLKPKLLILDEVTSALDPATEEEICNNIARLGGQYTVVAITHRPAWLKIATRAYDVSKGNVAPTRQAAAESADEAATKPGKPQILYH